MEDILKEDFALIAVAFWIFVALITIVPIVLHHRRRMETEKTIRMAIEKGANLDPAVLDRLLGASTAADEQKDTPEQSRRAGVIVGAVGVGIVLFSLVMGVNRLMGPAMIVMSVGVGLFYSARFMKPKDKA
jgi:hypothetical protein